MGLALSVVAGSKRGAAAGGVAEVFTLDFSTVVPSDMYLGEGESYAVASADASAGVYFWATNDAQGGDPGGSGRSVYIGDIATGQTAAQIAETWKAAIDADAAFVATRSGNVVTVTNASTGARTNASTNMPHLVVTTTVQGS